MRPDLERVGGRREAANPVGMPLGVSSVSLRTSLERESEGKPVRDNFPYADDGGHFRVGKVIKT